MFVGKWFETASARSCGRRIPSALIIAVEGYKLVTGSGACAGEGARVGAIGRGLGNGEGDSGALSRNEADFELSDLDGAGCSAGSRASEDSRSDWRRWRLARQR